MADTGKVASCGHCGSEVRIIKERDLLVFWICDRCGCRGADSVPDMPRHDSDVRRRERLRAQGR